MINRIKNTTLYFSLMEMTIVVFVITILMGIGGVVSSKIINDTRVTAMEAESKIVETAIMQYANSHDNELPLGNSIVSLNQEVKNIIKFNLLNEGLSDTVYDDLLAGGHFKELDYNLLKPFIQGDLEYSEQFFLIENTSSISGYNNEFSKKVLSQKVLKDGDGTLVAGSLSMAGSSKTITGSFMRPVIQLDENALKVAGYTDSQIIKTASEFNTDIRNNLTGTFILANDIDLSSYVSWDPIGKESPSNGITNAFKGKLLGNGYKIKNLNINSGGVRVGLFGETYGATIANLGIENVSINISGDTAGALIGMARNNTTVSNIYVENKNNTSIVRNTGTTTNAYTGGVIGKMDDSTLTFSFNKGITVEGSKRVGGLVGQASKTSAPNKSIYQLYSTGNVRYYDLSNPVSSSPYDRTNPLALGSNIGGLIGRIEFFNVSNSYATGNVTGFHGVGGLIGGNNSGFVSNTYAIGAVIGLDGYINETPEKMLVIGGVVGTGGGYQSTASPTNPIRYTKNYWDYTNTNAAALPSAAYRRALWGYGNSKVRSITYNGIVYAGSHDGYPEGIYEKNTIDMKKKSTYVGWDESIWKIEDGSYPTLK